MNQEFCNRWADALDSGEYEQGFGGLNNGKTYCCLGVACELLVEDGILDSRPKGNGYVEYGEKGTIPDTDSIYVSGTTWDASVLPPAACEYIGIERNGALVNRKGSDYRGGGLVHMNDGLRVGFDRIAQIIRGVDPDYRLVEAQND